jgi:hypothetical protein
VAVNSDNLDVVKFLLAHGANPNLEDKKGFLPLVSAASNGYLSVVKILLNHDANQSKANGWGVTPLMAAIFTGHPDIVKILPNNGPGELFNVYRALLKQSYQDLSTGQGYDWVKQIIVLSKKVKRLPPIPSTYRREMVMGLQAVKDAKSSDGYQRAFGYFLEAAKQAPWIPAPYEALGHVSEAEGHYEAARKFFSLYLLAAPEMQNAQAIQDHIYELEEKSGEK